MAVISGMILAGIAGAGLVSLEPDLFGSGTMIPTNLGARLSLGNAADNTLVALEPTGTYGISPSTGSLIYGWQTLINMTDFDRARTFEAVMDYPTSYVAVDVLWPYEEGYYCPGCYGFSEGVIFQAYDTSNSVLFSKIYPPGMHGTYDRLSLFQSGIKRIIVGGYDAYGPSGGDYFGADHFVFNASPGLNLKLDAGQTVEAPNGMNIQSGDEVSGNGTIDGNLSNQGGMVSPGDSAGEITITGSFHQNLDGITVMDVGSIESDHIVIGGEAYFGGILELVLLDELALTEGELLELMTYSTLGDGRFTEIRGLDLLGNNLDIVYGESSLGLIRTSVVPLPAGIWLMGIGSIGLMGLRNRLVRRIK
ncbi:MAG: hypothetical protein JW829_12380 [Pirellulales bacterium]|nr:hypothetical protein [Pirellulales bacterium]